MKQIIVSLMFIVGLTASYPLWQRLEAAESNNLTLAQAEAPALGDNWTWTYRAVDKLYGGAYTSNTLNGIFEITYQNGRLRFLRESGRAMIAEHNPRELHLMVPTRAVIQAKSQYFQFPLQVGKTWEGSSLAKRPRPAEHKVVGVETVTTPAGSFPAFRIERRIMQQTHYNDRDGIGVVYLTYVYFYSPKTRSIVKYHFQMERKAGGGGDLFLERTVDIELIKRGSTPAAVLASAPAVPTQQTAQVLDNIESQYLPPQPEMKGEEIARPKQGALMPNQELALGTLPPSSAGAGPLTLRMNLIGQRKEADGSYTEILVREGSMLRSRDNFQVHFETTSPAFIYILLYDSQGKASQLFPDPKIETVQLCRGRKEHCYPG